MVVAELLEEFSIVFQEGRHDASESLIVLYARVLLVAVCLGVLIRLVGSDPHRDLLGDKPSNAVGVGPLYVPENLIEGLQDIRESVEIRLGHATATARRHRSNLGGLVG